MAHSETTKETSMNKHSEELKSVTDNQLVAAWNILQFSLRMICDKTDLDADINAVSAELKVRGIPHFVGKKIIKSD